MNESTPTDRLGYGTAIVAAMGAILFSPAFAIGMIGMLAKREMQATGFIVVAAYLTFAHGLLAYGVHNSVFAALKMPGLVCSQPIWALMVTFLMGTIYEASANR